MEFKIGHATDTSQLEDCARLMSASDPWLTLGRSFEDCIRAVSGSGREVYIVTNDGMLMGFAVLQMTGIFRGYIQSVCIEPRYRSKGIGSALLKFCEERIFKESPNIFLCVSSFNRDAQRLYYKLGYEKVGELKNFIVQGHSEMLLRKTIGALAEFRPMKEGNDKAKSN